MREKIYLSTLCINFQEYDWLKDCIDEFKEFPVGVEFGTWWELQPQLPEILDAKKPLFFGVPTTIHAPFFEICNPAGSSEETQMKETFQRAIRVYHECGAISMVMHTNEKSFPVHQRLAMREKSREMILYWAGRCKEDGIALTVENVGYPQKDNCLFSYEEFVALFRSIPEEIGCLIDVGHAMLNDWDIVGLIRTMGPRIRGYHLNNNDGHGDVHYPAFDPDGCYTPQRMEEVVKTIAQYSPDADLILEYAAGPKITRARLHSDIRRVAEIMDRYRS